MPCQSSTLSLHLYLGERDSEESHFLDLCTSPSIMHPSWNSCLTRQD